MQKSPMASDRVDSTYDTTTDLEIVAANIRALLKQLSDATTSKLALLRQVEEIATRQDVLRFQLNEETRRESWMLDQMNEIARSGIPEIKQEFDDGDLNDFHQQTSSNSSCDYFSSDITRPIGIIEPDQVNRQRNVNDSDSLLSHGKNNNKIAKRRGRPPKITIEECPKRTKKIRVASNESANKPLNECTDFASGYPSHRIVNYGSCAVVLDREEALVELRNLDTTISSVAYQPPDNGDTSSANNNSKTHLSKDNISSSSNRAGGYQHLNLKNLKVFVGNKATGIQLMNGSVLDDTSLLVGLQSSVNAHTIDENDTNQEIVPLKRGRGRPRTRHFFTNSQPNQTFLKTSMDMKSVGAQCSDFGFDNSACSSKLSSIKVDATHVNGTVVGVVKLEKKSREKHLDKIDAVNESPAIDFNNENLMKRSRKHPKRFIASFRQKKLHKKQLRKKQSSKSYAAHISTVIDSVKNFKQNCSRLYSNNRVKIDRKKNDKLQLIRKNSSSKQIPHKDISSISVKMQKPIHKKVKDCKLTIRKLNVEKQPYTFGKLFLNGTHSPQRQFEACHNDMKVVMNKRVYTEMKRDTNYSDEPTRFLHPIGDLHPNRCHFNESFQSPLSAEAAETVESQTMSFNGTICSEGKKKRGRPRKSLVESELTSDQDCNNLSVNQEVKKRGRPSGPSKKNSIVFTSETASVDQVNDMIKLMTPASFDQVNGACGV